MPAMGNLSHINHAITCCVSVWPSAVATRACWRPLQHTAIVSQPITQISQQVNTILRGRRGAVFEIMETEPRWTRAR